MRSIVPLTAFLCLLLAASANAAPRGPKAPAGLAAGSATTSTVTLSWRRPTDARAVRVAIFRDGVRIALVQRTATKFVDRTVVAGKSHAYALASVPRRGLPGARSPVVRIVVPGFNVSPVVPPTQPSPTLDGTPPTPPPPPEQTSPQPPAPPTPPEPQEPDPVVPPPPVPVFAEEFSGASNAAPSASTWNVQTGDWGRGNNEAQCYVNSRDNVATDGGGMLVITATSQSNQCESRTLPYRSARIDSFGKRSFQYGRIEARMRVPTGQGLWPAFWTLGTNNYTDGWPESGEIDILESIGSDAGTRAAHANAHLPKGPKGSLTGRFQSGKAQDATGDLSAGFHVYGIEWRAGRIDFQLDGVTYHSITRAQVEADGARWVFDTTPQFLVLNLAVGGAGSWPGPPSVQTAFPARMYVDWVRVYA